MKRVSGLLADRPAAARAMDVLFLATDNGKTYRSNGFTWLERTILTPEDKFNGRRTVSNAGALPVPGTCLGWLYYVSGDDSYREAFPTGWANVTALFSDGGISEAAAAQSVAETAQSTAEEAQGTAEEAQSTAATAQSTAEGAIELTADQKAAISGSEDPGAENVFVTQSALGSALENITPPPDEDGGASVPDLGVIWCIPSPIGNDGTADGTLAHPAATISNAINLAIAQQKKVVQLSVGDFGNASINVSDWLSLPSGFTIRGMGVRVSTIGSFYIAGITEGAYLNIVMDGVGCASFTLTGQKGADGPDGGTPGSNGANYMVYASGVHATGNFYITPGAGGDGYWDGESASYATAPGNAGSVVAGLRDCSANATNSGDAGPGNGNNTGTGGSTTGLKHRCSFMVDNFSSMSEGVVL